MWKKRSFRKVKFVSRIRIAVKFFIVYFLLISIAFSQNYTDMLNKVFTESFAKSLLPEQRLRIKTCCEFVNMVATEAKYLHENKFFNNENYVTLFHDELQSKVGSALLSQGYDNSNIDGNEVFLHKNSVLTITPVQNGKQEYICEIISTVNNAPDSIHGSQVQIDITMSKNITNNALSNFLEYIMQTEITSLNPAGTESLDISEYPLLVPACPFL